MPLVDHPKVRRGRVVVRVNLPDPSIKHVLEVEVDMPLAESDEDFDQKEFAELMEAVKKAMVDGIDSAEIHRADA